MNEHARHDAMPRKPAPLAARAALGAFAIFIVPSTSLEVVTGEGVMSWVLLCLGVLAGLYALGAWTPQEAQSGPREPAIIALRVLAALGAGFWFSMAWLEASYGATWLALAWPLSWTAFLIFFAVTGWNPVAYFRARSRPRVPSYR